MRKIRIENFKTIGALEAEISPTTLLIGPPSSGKSNFMEAIALAGYFNRLLLLKEEYDNNVSYLEDIKGILRFSEPSHLFRFHDIAGKKIKISISNGPSQDVELFYEKGNLKLKINDVLIPWNLLSAPSNLNNLTAALNNALEKSPLIESRLYGFDRYGLTEKIYSYMKNMHTSDTPKAILSEYAKNLPKIIRSFLTIIDEINEVFSLQETRFELKLLRSGALVLFDYNSEVDPILASDAVGRTLYYILALKSSATYAKLHGLENKMVICLEEPEAHVFPYFFDLFIEKIVEVSKIIDVIVTTHNPLFASLLCDKVKDIEAYYVYRDRRGSTKMVKISMEKLAEEYATIADLSRASPSEIVERFSTPLKEVSGSASH